MKFHATGPAVAGTLLLGLAATVAADPAVAGSSWGMGSEVTLMRRAPARTPSAAAGSSEREERLSRSGSAEDDAAGEDTEHHKFMRSGNEGHDAKVQQLLTQLAHMCNDLPDLHEPMHASWLMDQRSSTGVLGRREKYLRNAYWVRALKIDHAYKHEPEKRDALRCWNEMSGIVAMSENKVTMDSMIKERRRKACHQGGHVAAAAGASAIMPLCVIASAVVYYGTLTKASALASTIIAAPVLIAHEAQPKASSSKGGRDSMLDDKDLNPKETNAGCKDGHGAYTCAAVLGKKPSPQTVPTWYPHKGNHRNSRYSFL